MLLGQGAGGVLEAEDAQLLRRRADEGDAGGFAGFGEGGVLGEEAVAGVDGGGTAFAGGGEDLVDHQVGAGGGAFAEAEGFVGLLDVQAGGVGFGVDGDAAYAQFMKSTQDAAGNGAAVGDQQFLEHEGVLMSGGPSRRYWVCTTVVRGGNAFPLSLWKRVGVRVFVGWVERSDTHQSAPGATMGIASSTHPTVGVVLQALSGAALAQQEQPLPERRRAGATRHRARMIGGFHPPDGSQFHTRSSAGVGL
ncbi:hypothetical protein D3C78_1024430 [compost metagenome]